MLDDGDYSDLHFAADTGDLPSVKELLDNGSNPNQFDEIGNTPLHYASKGGHHDVMRALIAAGANVNAHHEETISDTALAGIAGNCSLETATILIQAGADPRIRGWMQLNALDRAEKRKRDDGPAVYRLLQDAARRLGATAR
jgi:ankyrin repeat protein